MIYVVHGSDYAQTRKLIISQQKKLGISLKTEVDLEDISPIRLLEIVSTFDIFGNPPFVVLDVSESKNKEYDEHITVLSNMPVETVVIIQSHKALGKTNPFIKNAQKLKAKIAQTDITIMGNVFKFVDNMFYKNRGATYKELQILLSEGNDIFYILTMIFYGLRTLAQAKFGSESFSNKSGFIKGKAEKQAQQFSEKEILKLFDETYKIEKNLKTGETTAEMALTNIIEKVLA